MWDIYPGGRTIGGAPANFAYHASQLGIDSYAVSAVGNDALDNEVLDILKKQGVRHCISRVGYPTGTVHIALDSHGIPQYSIAQNVAWDNIPFDERLKALAGKTNLVCFGSLAQRNAVSRATICRFVDAMPTENAIRLFDINLRMDYYSREVIHESLMRCNALKINDEELAVVARLFNLPATGQCGQCVDLLKRYSLDMVILTCGAEGSHIITANELSFCPTPKVVVADTVGAGDSFAAAFCAALLNGKGLQDAHRVATAVAAYVCTQRGSMPAIPMELKQEIVGR